MSGKGELFLGKSFDALKGTEPPAFIQDLDAYFMAVGMKGSFPWIFQLASYFPSKQWQAFQQAPARLRTVSLPSPCFDISTEIQRNNKLSNFASMAKMP